MPATLRSALGALDRTPASYAGRHGLPNPLRLAAIVLAFVGSGIFGASLSLVLPGWESAPAALWLILSAGLAWAVFIPALAAIHRLPLIVCLDAALIAITGGEVILLSGAAGNLLAWCTDATVPAAAVNLATVAISNVVMAALLACKLRRHGVPVIQSLAAWVLVLDGSGALFFAIFYSLLHRA